ncbi:MAG: T9SS type A sorting domain-containing protein [Candidatus Cloacimonetes bacterium]|nr:T9SS type A sorting domain-containing protein [Candidatus Cloacimonadota bacterium]
MHELKIIISIFIFCSILVANDLSIKDYLKNPDFYQKNNFQEIKRFLPKRSLKIEQQDTQYWQNNSWKDSLRYHYNYNNSGEIEEVIYYTFENGNSENYGRLLYTYNTSNNLETAIWQDFENAEWVNNYKYNYYYNEEELLSQNLYQGWVDNAWLSYSIGEYIYNEDEELSYEIWKYWINEGELLNWTQNIYSYDENSNLLENFRQLWQENDWQNSFRYNYSYQDDNLISYYYQYWETDNFLNSYQYNYQYFNDLISEASYEEWNEDWIEVSQGSYEYDENGNLIEETWQTWKNSILENDVRYLYEYSEISTAENDNINSNITDLQIYPNPFSNNFSRSKVQISFTLSEKSKINLDVYNIKGQKIDRLVQNQHKSAGIHSLNWEIPQNTTNGIYLIRLQTEQFQNVSRIIIFK